MSKQAGIIYLYAMALPFNVSVVIPVFNAAPFLLECVTSALHLEEVKEVLLVEDASSDESLAICRKLEKMEPRVRLLQHPKGMHKGASASRNLGMLVANCPFIAFLDADDVFLPNRFKNTFKVFASSELKHPLDTVHGVYEAVGVLPTNLQHNKPELTTVRAGVAPEELFFKINPIGNEGYFSLLGLTIRKDFLRVVGYFNESLPLAQDTDWILRLCALGHLQGGELVHAVAMRRIHTGNRSNDPTNLLHYKVQMARECLDTLIHSNVPKAHQKALLRLYLRYRWEWVHLSGRYRQITRKYLDLSHGLRLWWRYPTLRKDALLGYHFRTLLKLPVDRHLNYYAKP